VRRTDRNYLLVKHSQEIASLAGDTFVVRCSVPVDGQQLFERHPRWCDGVPKKSIDAIFAAGRSTKHARCVGEKLITNVVWKATWRCDDIVCGHRRKRIRR
jgi:hypothetical protein